METIMTHDAIADTLEAELIHRQFRVRHALADTTDSRYVIAYFEIGDDELSHDFTIRIADHDATHHYDSCIRTDRLDIGQQVREALHDAECFKSKQETAYA